VGARVRIRVGITALPPHAASGKRTRALQSERKAMQPLRMRRGGPSKAAVLSGHPLQSIFRQGCDCRPQHNQTKERYERRTPHR